MRELMEIDGIDLARAVASLTKLANTARVDVVADHLARAAACKRHRQREPNIAEADDGDPVARGQREGEGHARKFCSVDPASPFPQPKRNVNRHPFRYKPDMGTFDTSL